jgi:hypothetical protein
LKADRLKVARLQAQHPDRALPEPAHQTAVGLAQQEIAWPEALPARHRFVEQ